MGLRNWLNQPVSSASSRKIEAEAQADAAKARKRIADLDRERRSGRCGPKWYAQEYDRASDDLDYALGRGPYKN